jgi:pyruvate carboxylase
MRRAIGEYRIQGIRTNLGFFAELLEDDEFKAGRISTQFIEEFFRRRPKKPEPSSGFIRAAAVAAALAHRDQTRATETTVASISPWRLSLRNPLRVRSQKWRT